MLLFHNKKSGFNLQACDVICTAIIFGSATYAVKAMVTYIGFSNYEELASLTIYILWGIVYGRFLINNQKLIINLLVAETIYLSILYVNYKLFPNTREFYEEYYMFLRQIVVVYIPSMTVALKISNFTGYIKIFRKVGIVGIILMIVAYFMGFIERWEYQQFGINICPFVVMILPSYLIHHRINDLMWMLLGFILLMAGGRQSFVAFFMSIAVILYCIKFHDLSLRKKISYACIAMFGFIVLIIFIPYLIIFLGNLLKIFGMESRTMDMLTGNELFSTSTRDYIYELSLYYIKNNLYNIQGLFADRYLLRLTDDWIAYPHNLILELMIDFGVVIGALLSIIIFIQYIIQIIKSNLEKRTVIGILATIVIIRLMVSSSYMIEGLFYTVVGLLLNPYDMKRQFSDYITNDIRYNRVNSIKLCNKS